MSTILEANNVYWSTLFLNNYHYLLPFFWLFIIVWGIVIWKEKKNIFGILIALAYFFFFLDWVINFWSGFLFHFIFSRPISSYLKVFLINFVDAFFYILGCIFVSIALIVLYFKIILRSTKCKGGKEG